MPKPSLYSRSPRRDAAPRAAASATPSGTGSGHGTVPAAQSAAVAAATPGPLATDRPPSRLRAAAARHAAPLWALGGAALAVAVTTALQPPTWLLTQEDIDRAVRSSLEAEPLPSQAAKAYEAILPSVVRVIGINDDDEPADANPEQRAMERSLGTGVVIVEDGTILTNLHVVWGSKRIRVRFFNGQESEALMVGAQPENDLAVLKATTLPDDMEPAVMTSTADLRPGDHVMAVGHPFGIGPSASYGVVSGLGREFRSPEGAKTLSNLIQFDAAANPGNSGGPLVTMDGHVVGIVTAILNPSEQRTFIGIGFAVPIENAASAAGMPPF
jgi:S1-C subfamily serine protease